MAAIRYQLVFSIPSRPQPPAMSADCATLCDVHRQSVNRTGPSCSHCGASVPMSHPPQSAIDRTPAPRQMLATAATAGRHARSHESSRRATDLVPDRNRCGTAYHPSQGLDPKRTSWRATPQRWTWMIALQSTPVRRPATHGRSKCVDDEPDWGGRSSSATTFARTSWTTEWAMQAWRLQWLSMSWTFHRNRLS